MHVYNLGKNLYPTVRTLFTKKVPRHKNWRKVILLKEAS